MPNYMDDPTIPKIGSSDVITTLNTIQSIDLNVTCMLCHDGFIRHMQFADGSLPEHGPELKHFSEIFNPEVNAVIAAVIYESRYLPGQYQKRISTGGGKKSKNFDVSISSIEIPETSHPFFQVSVRSQPARKKEDQKTTDLNEQLRYTNAQKDKLFSIIAHDFRSPFAGCLGMLEMVLEDRDSYDRAEIYQMLEMIYKQSQSTFHLLESLLDWASVQQGQLNYSPVKSDLRTLVDLMCNMLGNDTREKKIELLNKIPDQTFVFADIYMLKTILRNLISNGIKFTNPEGQIVIEAVIKGEMIEISVTDNGIGIQKSSQMKIFDIDYLYIGRGTKGEKGTGIGLHVCRDFVHKHGGDISVESEPGSGSIFRFTLPAK